MYSICTCFVHFHVPKVVDMETEFFFFYLYLYTRFYVVVWGHLYDRNVGWHSNLPALNFAWSSSNLLPRRFLGFSPSFFSQNTGFWVSLASQGLSSSCLRWGNVRGHQSSAKAQKMWGWGLGFIPYPRGSLSKNQSALSHGWKQLRKTCVAEFFLRLSALDQ